MQTYVPAPVVVWSRLWTRLVASLILGVSAGATACAADVSAPATSAPPVVETTTNAAGEEIVVRTNAERQKLGLPALARIAALMSAAQLQANQMAALNTMAHELPGASYPTPSSRLEAVGYQMSASGENVAEGYPTPAAVVAGWMASPGHRDNILSTNFTQMGAGVAAATNGRMFYAQVFGRPRV